MKLHLTIILCFVFNIVFAQPTGDIQKDTAQANKLYEEAMNALPEITDLVYDYLWEEAEKVDTFSQIPVIRKLETAIELLDKYPVTKQKIRIKGDLAFFYVWILEESIAYNYALQTLKEAASNNIDSLDNCLFTTYITLVFTGEQRGIYPSDYAEKAYLSALPISNAYLFFQKYYLPSVIHYGKEALYEERVEIFKSIIENPKNEKFAYGIVYYNEFQMDYYGKLIGNSEKSISYGIQALITNKKYNALNNESLAMIYYQLGNSYMSLKQFDKARISFNKAFQLTEHSKGQGLILLELASLENFAGNRSKFFDYTLQAKEKFLIAEDAHLLSIIYKYLADYYLANGDLDLMKESIEKGFEYGRHRGTLLSFGQMLGQIGEYDNSLNLLQEALVKLTPNFNSMNIADNPSKEADFIDKNRVGRILYIKSKVLYQKALESDEVTKQQLLQLSASTNKIAAHLLGKTMLDLNGFEFSKLIFNENMSTILENELLLHYEFWKENKNVKNVNNFIKVLEQKKMASLVQSFNTPDLSPALEVKKAALLNNKSTYELKLLLQDNEDSITYYNNKLLTLSDELEILEQEVINIQQTKPFFYQDKWVNLTEIQEQLDDKTLFVQYGFANENNLFILSISKTNYTLEYISIQDVFFKNIKQLSQLLQSQTLIKNKNREQFIDIAYTLYQQLLTPIQSQLNNHSKIIFANDKQLHHIPFEVLLATNDKKPFYELDFLIKKYDISYQYSATIYAQLKNKSPIKNSSLLAFAPVFSDNVNMSSARNIDFLPDSLYQGIEKRNFTVLPETKKEVETIATIVGNKGHTMVLLEQMATKANYQNAINNNSYQFIHIATHGLVNYQNPNLSALACYSQDDKIETNLLFSSEIELEDVRADLVVLSSCESGIGQLIYGEGLIALNRSFIASGANNVIFSLWKVNDEFTSKLMIDFYKFYFETDNYTEALRQAKLKMLNDPIAANPRYWAAFVLIGE